MIDIWLVVFREFIEISIITGIIFAGISFVKNVHLYFILSFLISAVLAFIFSFSINSIANSFDGLGEEIFNCVILSITVFFMLFTIVIMKDHARKLKKETAEFASNKQELVNISLKKSFGIIFLISSSILKEFIEIVMFIKSISLTNKYSSSVIYLPCIIGAASGFFVGFLIYRGLLKFSIKYIFKITNILLIIVAAGLFSEVARILLSTGLVEVFKSRAFDLSGFISDSSIFGRILKILFGYVSKPSWLEVIFYLSVIVLIFVYSRIELSLVSSNKSASNRSINK